MAAFIAERKSRKAGLPKREPVSKGGHSFSIPCASSRTASSATIAASCAAGESWTAEIVMSRTESDRWKTKLTIRSCVDDAVNSSWSRSDKILRVGVVYVWSLRSGAGASAGVGGGGFDDAAAAESV